jgi:uncharacterized delta-60 repeat protein
MQFRLVPSVAAAIVSIAVLGQGLARATPGALDEAFGTSGKVSTAIGSGNDVSTAVAVQTDGAIVASGQADVGAQTEFAVVRYDPNGALDASFGGTGIVTTPIGSVGDSADAVALQSDGKIVVGGASYQGPTTGNDFALARYDTDGSLDTTFGSGGIVVTVIGNSTDVVGALAIQQDGKLIAAGSAGGVPNTFAVARYDADGVLDASFGVGGVVITPIGAYAAFAHTVALQSDGRIIVAGSSSDGTYTDFALARYETDGSLDVSFGTGGVVTTAVGNGNDSVAAVAVQSDGKIVAGGVATVGVASDFGLVRYEVDGSLDTSFGSGGKVLTPIGGSAAANALTIQPVDGGIVAVGSTSTGPVRAWALARYTADGTLDPSFGSGGVVTTAFGTLDDAANAVALDADGDIVAAGYTNNGTNTDFALARYAGSVGVGTTTTTLPFGRIPGGGSTKGDCYAELGVFGIDNASELVQKNKIVLCTDGDACDTGACGDGECDVRLVLCINQLDSNLPECTPPEALDSMTIKPKGKVRLDVAAPASLQGAQCGSVVDDAIPVKRDKKGRVRGPGKAKIRIVAKAPKGTKPRPDRDVVTIKCLPRTSACPG